MTKWYLCHRSENWGTPEKEQTYICLILRSVSGATVDEDALFDDGAFDDSVLLAAVEEAEKCELLSH